MTEIFNIPQDEKHLRIIAHRGTTVFAPENTAASFEYAGVHKAWAIETDLRFTKDGEIVCIHDSTVDRRYNGKGMVSKMTLAELRELRANSEGFDIHDEKLIIPTLSEYLDICERYGSIPFIEIKDDVVEQVVNALKERKLKKRAVISSSNIEHLRKTRTYSKEIFIHHIFSKTEFIDELCCLGNSGAAYNYPELDEVPEGLIDYVHSKGLKVCLRAGDTPDNVRRMLKMGIDYIPSNCIYSI